MNPTALVLAHDQIKKTLLMDRLSATGLFKQIKAFASSSELFHYLSVKSADMVCWAIEKSQPRKNDWITRLQAQERWHDLPLIAFAEDQQSLIEGFSLGASDAVHVEVDANELSARINTHLQRWQRLLELRKSQEQLQKMALTDPLTQLGNRATFDMSIKQAVARSQRSEAPCSLLMIDLDHFKAFNDTHGHPVGDQILLLVAQAIRRAARDSDICCRYGGEEFAVILPDTTSRNAEILADRIHRQVRKVSQNQPRERRPITVSIGISSTHSCPECHPHELIEEADQALYLAKSNGRNRTETWGLENPVSTPLQNRYSYRRTPQLAFGG